MFHFHNVTTAVVFHTPASSDTLNHMALLRENGEKERNKDSERERERERERVQRARKAG